VSNEATAIDVNIMGREFRISCTEEERDDLLQAVDYLDGRMREIRDAGKVAGVDRIAIMAALNIAHELLHTRVGGGVDLGDVRRRICAMQASIDAVMQGQEKLF
jgi:cell division protein ZapA